MRKIRIAGRIVGMMLAMFLAGCGQPPPPPGSAREGAKEFSLPNLEGKSVSLADFKGSVVILNFWATWCPPCKKEIPDFVALHEQMQKEGKKVVVVGISLDDEGPSIVKEFVDRFKGPGGEPLKITYPILIGNEKVSNDYGKIVGVPTTFVLDPQGRIYKKYVGLRPIETYTKDIQALLGER